MKFNEKTLKKTIKELSIDIIQSEQDLIAMNAQKAELESELKTLRLIPPLNAIKNALKRLGMYPKLKQTTRREANDTKQHTQEDVSDSNICEGLNTSSYKKVSPEFSQSRVQHDLSKIDDWLDGQFKSNRELENQIRCENGLNP